jgi:hypothetical protein
MLYLVFLESDYDLLTNDYDWKGASVSQFPYFIQGLLFVFFRQQIDIGKFVLDAAFPQESLTGLTMTACAQRIQFANWLHYPLLLPSGKFAHSSAASI